MAMIRVEGIGIYGGSVLTYIPSVQKVVRWGSHGFLRLKEMGDLPLYTYHSVEIVEIDIVVDSYASLVSSLDLFETMEEGRGG